MGVQSVNRRSNIFLTYKGQKNTISQWAKIIGVKRATLSWRIKRLNWSVEKALTTGHAYKPYLSTNLIAN